MRLGNDAALLPVILATTIADSIGNVILSWDRSREVGG
jgi:hypothetical protein